MGEYFGHENEKRFSIVSDPNVYSRACGQNTLIFLQTLSQSLKKLLFVGAQDQINKLIFHGSQLKTEPIYGFSFSHSTFFFSRLSLSLTFLCTTLSFPIVLEINSVEIKTTFLVEQESEPKLSIISCRSQSQFQEF